MDKLLLSCVILSIHSKFHEITLYLQNPDTLSSLGSRESVNKAFCNKIEKERNGINVAVEVGCDIGEVTNSLFLDCKPSSYTMDFAI